MFPSIKGWLIGLAVVAALALIWGYGHHEYIAGAQSVQVKWDAASGAQAGAALTSAGKTQSDEFAQATGFVAIDSTFQKATANAKDTADPFLARVNAGSVSLRNAWQCPQGASGAGGSVGRTANAVPKAAAASVRPDAEAARYAEHRGPPVQSVLSIGHDADAEKAQLRAQIAGLQALLLKERESQ